VLQIITHLQHNTRCSNTTGAASVAATCIHEQHPCRCATACVWIIYMVAGISQPEGRHNMPSQGSTTTNGQPGSSCSTRAAHLASPCVRGCAVVTRYIQATTKTSRQTLRPCVLATCTSPGTGPASGSQVGHHLVLATGFHLMCRHQHKGRWRTPGCRGAGRC
jgi:hypothetical protein